MSKNVEIIAEIISEEVGKLEKIVLKQSELISDFKITIEKAENISIKTERIEEVISYWNDLFNKQKAQIQSLKKEQKNENRNHRIITYIILTALATAQALILFKTI